MGGWVTQKVLITVRTYPTPAYKGLEVSCTAGITDTNKWIRLFPLPYRYLASDKKFKKYQWIEVSTKKANDPRPESYNLDRDSIKIISESLPTKDNWKARKEIVLPLKSHCLCCLQKQRDSYGSPTIGIFKPRSITAFKIEKSEPKWTPEQEAKLKQLSFFDNKPANELEKIPYTFSYNFTCDEPNCPGHELMCTDWEMGQSYRAWTKLYGTNWQSKFRYRYETEMILENETYFYVGTMHDHPQSWIIIGLFYPKLIK
jgi:hypothetical protein